MIKRLFIFTLNALCILAQLGAEITVTLDRETIGIDEAFTANFSSKEPIKREPDFSILQNDFKILSQSQNMMTAYRNGQFSNETHYKLVLRPKTTGRITIPSISFGQELSPSKIIEVTNTATSKPDSTLFFETEISPNDTAYPLTQVIYTVRLYRSVNLAQAGLSEVKVSDPDAIVERLGKDNEYEYIHPNGTRFIALERKYAVFPQHSGELIFSPVVFEGQVIKGGNAFYNIQTEFKRISSESEKITVLDIPAPFHKNNWFSAQNLNLKEEWSADPANIKVGEPITWTLTVVAEGCLGNQIPEIALNLPPNVKQYNDKPEITNNPSAKGFTGVRKIKTALIATKPGELILPEISLKWWDLKTNQMRIATLPSRTIQVEEGLVALSDQVNAQHETSTVLSTEDLKLDATKGNEERVGSLPSWAWGLIGLNLIWVIILFRNIFKKVFGNRSGRNEDSDTGTQTFSRRHVKSLIKQACHNGDAKQAEAHVLMWAKIQFPHVDIFNLAQIKKYVAEPLQEAIHELNVALYGNNQDWDGLGLWEAIKKHSKCKSTIAKLKGEIKDDEF